MTRWFLLLLLAASLGCDGDAGQEKYVLTFVSESDPGQPLANVAIQIDGIPAGKSKADGTLKVAVKNKPGARVELSAACPEGYQPARISSSLPLRHLRSIGGKNARTDTRIPIVCPPTHRVAALVIRTVGKPGLPVLVNGRELGRTDQNGIAHIQVRSLPYSNLRVLIDTAGQPALMPQDPELSFQLEDHDTIFVFDQPFVDKKEERRPKNRPVKVQRRPVKIS